MDIDPTIVEIISAIVLVLLGGGTGYSVRVTRGDALAERLAAIQEQLTDTVNTLDGLVKGTSCVSGSRARVIGPSSGSTRRTSRSCSMH